MRVRFAPSPTGQLHVGNARTALFNWLLARGHGGTFVLRIEDTDAERSSIESEASIVDELKWMGLTWDEGADVGGPHGPYRQSERLETYRSHASRLLADGTAYYCFCSAEQLEADRAKALATGEPPKYVGRCRGLDPSESAQRVDAGEPAVIRFKVPDGRDVSFHDVVRGAVTFSTEVIGDPVLVRSDGIPAYNFAVVVDDALMEITHVVRGEDHVSNTPRQVLLYEAFGYRVPTFAHLSLVLGPDHSPLSKRHGATSVAEFRQKGYLPEALVNYLALIGWSPGADDELLPLPELARRFRLEHVGHSAGVFDEAKLAWVDRHYLKLADPARLARLLVPFFEAEGVLHAPSDDALLYLESLLPMITTSVDRLAEAPERLGFLFRYDAAETLRDAAIAGEFAAESPRAVVHALAADLASAGPLDSREAFRAAAQRVRDATGQKGRALFHPIRVALTGAAEGPELDLAVPAIEHGARLPEASGIVRVLSCAARAAAFVVALG
jgi:glutamyl-tRNA synthetase/nondiscriminating glutamyl-tRNA synthetase